MKNIGQANETRRNELLTALREAHDAISAKIDDANIAIREANEAIAAYSEQVEEANRFVEDVANEIAEYIGERSEKWQDGDAGQAYQEWLNEWQSFYGETADPFDELEEPSADAIDNLENALPSEPSV